MKKVIIFFLCITLLIPLAACTRPKDKTEEWVDPELLYAPITEAYIALVTAKDEGKTLTAPDASASESDKAIFEVVNNYDTPADLGYAVKDINGDGVWELLLMTRQARIYALYTLTDGVPVFLFRSSVTATIYENGRISYSEYIPDEVSRSWEQTLVNGRLEGLEFGSEMVGENVVHYKVENGIRTEITREERNDLATLYGHNTPSDPRYTNRKNGFRFIPAIQPDPSEEQPPVADFSTYEAILELYKTAVEQIPSYTRPKWIDGEYEDLYTFRDNANYEIFHRVLYGCANLKPTTEYFGDKFHPLGQNAYGYDKKDLNGDGVEELILMTDLYDLLAVFTMKEGKAVLLKIPYGAWLDENGCFRAHLSTGGVVDRDGEGYLYEIKDGGLFCHFGVGYQVNIYLQKEGWYKIENGVRTDISGEEGEALLAQVENLPDRWSSAEYTRNKSGLTFTPLHEASLAMPTHREIYSQMGYYTGYLTISDTSKTEVSFVWDYVAYLTEFDPEHPEIEPETFELTMEGVAVAEDGKYHFASNGVKGYLDFAVSGVWVVVTESTHEHLPCRAYLFDYPSDGYDGW